MRKIFITSFVVIVIFVLGIFYYLSSNNSSQAAQAFDLYNHQMNIQGYFKNGRPVQPDVPSFVVLTSPSNDGCIGLAKDKNYVYISPEVLIGADPASFVPLKDQSGKCTVYSKDKNNVFALSHSIDGADGASFIVLNGSVFAKDKNRVYYFGTPIENADLNTFTPIYDSRGIAALYAKDKNNIYASDPQSSETKILAQADLATFRLVPDTDSPLQCGQNCVYDAYDKNHKYGQGQVVQ